MSKKFQWALVIAIATAGIGAGTAYAANNGSDAFGLGKFTVSQDAASVEQHMRGAIKIVAPMMGNTELLSLLKLDEQALKEKREAGQTLAEVAEAQGVTRQQLIDFLTEQHATQLAQAVKDGKLNQEQADKMKASFPQMVEQMIDAKGKDKFFVQGGPRMVFGFHELDNAELLSLLKLEKQAFYDRSAAGQSLAEIAEAQGVTRQQLIDFLTKQNETRLAQGVKDGKIQQEQADQMKQHFSQMVEKLIDDKGHGDFKGHGGGKDMFFVFKKDNAELLALLKLDKQALNEKRKAGQSLAEIAEAQGVTRQQLIDFLTKQNETELAQAVTDGKIKQEQADKMKERFPQMVEKMIDAKPGDGKAVMRFEGRGPGKFMFQLPAAETTAPDA